MWVIVFSYVFPSLAIAVMLQCCCYTVWYAFDQILFWTFWLFFWWINDKSRKWRSNEIIISYEIMSSKFRNCSHSPMQWLTEKVKGMLEKHKGSSIADNHVFSQGLSEKVKEVAFSSATPHKLPPPSLISYINFPLLILFYVVRSSSPLFI